MEKEKEVKGTSIYCRIDPFIYAQDIIILDENNKQICQAGTCAFIELPQKVIELSSTLNIKKILLHGSSQYAKHIKEDIQKEENKQFAKNDLSIEIL